MCAERRIHKLSSRGKVSFKVMMNIFRLKLYKLAPGL